MSRVIVIMIKRGRTKLGRIQAMPPLKDHIPDKNWYVVNDRKELKKALGTLADGDILILDAHASYHSFDIGYDIEAIAWKDIWDIAGKKAPRLEGVFFASCMGTYNKSMPPGELKKLRQTFRANVAIAPPKVYDPKMKDPGGELLIDMVKWHNKRLSPQEFNSRLRKQKVFVIESGCNGYNHPDNCPCKFGLPKNP